MCFLFLKVKQVYRVMKCEASQSLGGCPFICNTSFPEKLWTNIILIVVKSGWLGYG